MQTKTEHGLAVEFYNEPVLMGFESEQAGRPIHKDMDHVHIMIPGDNKTDIRRVASEEDKKRFAIEYARYKALAEGREQLVGTPLTEWPAMPRSLVKDMEYLNIYTVEQLAGLSDQGKQAFGMGAEMWVQKAKAFIASATENAFAERLSVENADLKRQIDDLQKQFADLSAHVAKKTDTKKVA